jgi:hypothetical protein
VTAQQTPTPAISTRITWARAFPGTADQVGQARRFQAGPAAPRTVAFELVTG